ARPAGPPDRCGQTISVFRVSVGAIDLSRLRLRRRSLRSRKRLRGGPSVSLSAAQLVYTNVEKKLSPTGREGFQIWLRTPDVLSEGEESEIQTRLADYEERRDPTTKDEPAVRHSFFRLSTGKAVIAR